MKTLRSIATGIDAINEFVGTKIAWLALLMVLLQFVIVMLRYVFGLGWVAMQEVVVYLHASLFMIAAGYTLRHNGHVRCDIFYAETTPRNRAWVDLIGSIVCLAPFCIVFWLVSWPYVAASWAIHEGSPEGSLGLPLVYLLKSVMLAFAALLGVQGIAMAIRSILVLVGAERDMKPEEVEGI